MFKKIVFLDLHCSETPCNFTVLSCNGQIFKTIIISNCSKVCFCTDDYQIKLFATCNKQTIQQTLCLSNSLCQNYCISFVFEKIIPPKVVNLIELFDANYGFPVANATLDFKQRN